MFHLHQQELPVGERVYTRGFVNKYIGSFKKRGFKSTMVFWLWCLKINGYYYYKRYIKGIIYPAEPNIPRLYYYEDLTWDMLNKKYGKLVNEIDAIREPQEASNKVFVCWLQGFENAPDAIKVCYESLKRNLPEDKELISLTADNYSDYVTLPDYILVKWKKAIISNTIFSDILRVALLVKYGGVWIDAGTYVTGWNLPGEELFLLTQPNTFSQRRHAINGYLFSSGLIRAKSNNKVLIVVRDLMYRYWQDMDYSADYLIIHKCLSMAFKRFPEEFDKIPPGNTKTYAIALREMKSQPFNKEIFKEIAQNFSFHQIAFKFPSKQPGTFWDVIFNQRANPYEYTE